MTHTLVVLRDGSGLEGIGGAATFTPHDWDCTLAESLRTLLPDLIGREVSDVEAIWERLRPRTLPRPYGAQAAVDMALWDLRGKREGAPLYKLFGATRERVPAYASTPLFDSIDMYMDKVAELREMGFHAVKFHAWGQPERDLALCRAARSRFPDFTFMLDAEGNYTHEEALRAAHTLAELRFTWLEAPLPDFDIGGYRDLVRADILHILPAGNWIVELPVVEEMLRTRTWGGLRFDVGTCGGITPARKLLTLAERSNMNAEVQCWSYMPQQAANLHLILSSERCTYFEYPIPPESFVHGVQFASVIRLDSEGCVAPPSGPGLGVQLDWEQIEAATIMRLSFGVDC